MTKTITGVLISPEYVKGRPILLQPIGSPVPQYVLAFSDDVGGQEAEAILAMFIGTGTRVILTGTVEDNDYLPYLHVEQIGSNESVDV